MKMKIISVICFLSFLLPCISAQAIVKKENNRNESFDIDLTGYELYSFGDFNQLGYKITPLTQLFLGIVQTEGAWIDEPRLYIKGNKGYFHLWKEDGTNVLYTVEKSGDFWRIIDVKRKKINRIPVPKQFLKEVLINLLLEPISKEVENYYKEPKLWYRGFEKILEIKTDKTNSIFYVTVQIQTFEGAHNPPYGEDTITFRIKGNDVKTIHYKHRDIPEEELKKLELR
ncbi:MULTISPECIES: DUF3888 domain-containing protein [Bacillus cereus group]|uniref:DUF3888 domain-containing protein n=1 Tax=Bacillus cereus group TaxID=86661 RepID=UPI00065BCABE|nr:MULTISPECIES: DUF3888 domain-containing protein [Bacillus cereus group]KMP77958.1 hypothetical protein TU62_03480 [Bacillus cereus]MBG9855827.1 hypothetical protein [Bacillus wiedmannii]MBJ8081516.1 DUF3888 domain-containing protein [Bacillus cereus group sp. N14]MCQ6545168.1 DUF3888 domain-containing protein [Bacillus wiedmannii]MCQ6572197.1 DUF3888 domain-containing protein [Bacillus wiedmannii]